MPADFRREFRKITVECQSGVLALASVACVPDDCPIGNGSAVIGASTPGETTIVAVWQASRNHAQSWSQTCDSVGPSDGSNVDPGFVYDLDDEVVHGWSGNLSLSCSEGVVAVDGSGCLQRLCEPQGQGAGVSINGTSVTVKLPSTVYPGELFELPCWDVVPGFNGSITMPCIYAWSTWGPSPTKAAMARRIARESL